MERAAWSRGRLPPVRWSAIAAGTVAALAVHVTLGLFSGALGAAAERADSRALGFFAALLGLAVPLVAAALGAWLAVRSAGVTHPTGAHTHGLLVWALGLIAGAVFLTSTGLAVFGARGPNAQRAERTATANEVAGPTAGGLALGGLGALLGLAGGLIGAAAGRRALLAGNVFRRDPVRARSAEAGPLEQETYGSRDDFRADRSEGPYPSH